MAQSDRRVLLPTKSATREDSSRCERATPARGAIVDTQTRRQPGDGAKLEPPH